MKLCQRLTQLLCALLLLGVASSAQAEKAPATWGAEIRLGAYRPRVGNKTERGFYKQVHGADSPLMLGIEVERYVGYAYGLIGAFFRIGQWKNSGKARKCVGDVVDPNTGTTTQQTVECTAATVGSSVAAADKTALLVIPIGIGAIYRFDMLQERWGVPISPYAKAGIDYFFWRSSKGGKTESIVGTDANGNVTVKEGKGGTAGLHAALGFAVNLNWLEPGSNRRKIFLDSHLFAEMTQYWADGFGNRKEFDMSDRQYNFGLAFDFK